MISIILLTPRLIQGALGSNVARLLARSGISAAIANSRGPASLAGLAQELGPSIKAGTVREAASADIVLVAVRWVDLGKALIHWIGVAPSGPLSRPRKWESDDALCRGSRCGAAIRTRIILDQRGRIVGFAKLYDPVPIHTDKEVAARGPFGGLIASGFNTLAIYQRLIVEAVWTQVAGIVGRSFEVRLSRPMRPGTIITGYSKSKASPSDQSAATES